MQVEKLGFVGPNRAQVAFGGKHLGCPRPCRTTALWCRRRPGPAGRAVRAARRGPARSGAHTAALQLLLGILQNIACEHHANIDKFSQSVITAQLELLLTYADRFYHRQFITRKIVNHQILSRLEAVLAEYVNSDASLRKGLPTVQFVADTLHVSPNYLSALLKEMTGQSTQQHIQNKVIDKAKEKLSTTGLSVGEIAYQLGFEHSQSFSKLFKSKTNQSPLDFRRSFN